MLPNYEARADELLGYLIRGWPIPWYPIIRPTAFGGVESYPQTCNLHDIRDMWKGEHYRGLTGEYFEDSCIENRLRSDVRADWRDFLWSRCIEAAQVEKRPETYRHVQER